ncbi:hypothetical protein A2U01_0099857, partial [Trifolium medium]|nr:hypothetical protein [Trifolium medium]
RGWCVAPVSEKNASGIVLSTARCAASCGASRTFIVHHACCAEQVARRADAKSI